MESKDACVVMTDKFWSFILNPKESNPKCKVCPLTKAGPRVSHQKCVEKIHLLNYIMGKIHTNGVPSDLSVKAF